MTRRSIHARVLVYVLAISVALAACGGGDDPGGPDGPPGPDAPPGTPDAQPTDCTGDADRLILAGAYTYFGSSPGLVTVDSAVIGVGGAVPGQPPSTYTLVIRSIADGDYDAVAVHDLAAKNLKFLSQPAGGCAGGGCTGFFALGGTLTVSETTPRYRATFAFSDLRSRTDESDTEGPVLPGTITGCVNAPR